MSKYGYIGKESDIPQQAFKSNAGVLTTDDILQLSQNNKLTQFGQLELIETQDITTAVSDIEFTDLKENLYKVHLLTCTNVTTLTDQRHLVAQLSNDGGSTYETGSYTNIYLNNNTLGGQTSGTNSFLQYFSTSLGTGANEVGNGWIKFYNLGDSLKRTHCSHSFTGFNYNNTYQGTLGFAERMVEERVNAIKLTGHAATTWTGTFSLYGLREFN